MESSLSLSFFCLHHSPHFTKRAPQRVLPKKMSDREQDDDITEEPSKHAQKLRSQGSLTEIQNSQEEADNIQEENSEEDQEEHEEIQEQKPEVKQAVEEVEEEETDTGMMNELKNTLEFFSKQAESKEDVNFVKIHEDYEKLHKIFLQSRANEKKLVKRCRDLTLELQANANKVQAALKLSQNDRGTITSLKKKCAKLGNWLNKVPKKKPGRKRQLLA